MTRNTERRQELLALVPESLPVTRAWLLRQNVDFDRHAVDNLVKSGQLVALAQGVYMRPGTTPTWEGLVCFLQSVLNSNLTVGGLTALELRGLGHYVALSSKKVVHLYGKDTLPKWMNRVLPNIEFIRHTALATVDRLDLGTSGLVNDSYDTSLKKLYSDTLTGQGNTWPFTRSSPERAYLEILMDVPDTVSFEHADQLMQGLTTLSPRRLENLLKEVQTVKVRRLFYWFAERHQYAWFKKLPAPNALDELGLGSGNRCLVKGGKLDTKYKITVPEEMWTGTANTIDKSSF
ncbi:MAG: type IV toxin-antitoxin system AbiEi family antitoxin domain-containing protein [Pseudobdellovibrionaceae bacterium]